MAESVLSAAVSLLLDRLTPELLKFGARKGLPLKVDKLRNMLTTIRVVLIDTEEKQLTNKAVNIWLDDLQDCCYDMEDILDEYATELRIQENQASTGKARKPKQIAQKFNSEIDIITNRLEQLQYQKQELGLLNLSDRWGWNMPRQRAPTSCSPNEPTVYGRAEDKAKLLEMVLRPDNSTVANVGVIIIVGMGGIGKTTLAREVYNDEAMEQFDAKVWVFVSEDFDVERISKAILESISLRSSDDMYDLLAVQHQLKKNVAGKKLLLVLDDVWSENYAAWEELLAPFRYGAQGSKIIVTTRNEHVALAMRGYREYCHRLELLSDDDCWSLFKSSAFDMGTMVEQPSYLIRQKVIEKCKGLPLAAKTFGGFLRSKKIDDEWFLFFENWELRDENVILGTLQLSYYNLPPCLKKCFAYCAVFPKGYEFEEKEVILLWIAQGLIQQSEYQLEDVGGNYFRDLVSRSIFLISSRNNTKYVMHDLVHYLAQKISREICFRWEDELKSNKQSILSERTPEHVRTLFPVLPMNDQSKPYYISNTVVSDLLMKFEKLRVLSLQKYNISELPNSIKGLRLLRFLNLSSSEIRSLPESIDLLCNLQTLILRNCHKLLKLPHSMGNLFKLRHLDIWGASLIDEMPLRIRKWECLRTLSNFIVGKGSGSSLEELEYLKFLRGELHISRLENVIDFYDTRELLLSDKNLQVLVLEWGSKFDDSRDDKVEEKILDWLQPPKSIKELTVACYGGTKFPSWIADPSLYELTVLRLEGCENCTFLPSLGLLVSLKNLTISRMKGLKSIGSEFCGEGCSNPFQSLEILHFEDLEEWEHWDPVKENEHVECFHSLRELSIVRCPKLSGSIPNNLVLLEKLVILKCAELVLSFSTLPVLCKLEIDECKRIVCSSPTGCETLNSLSLSNISDCGDMLRQEFQKVEHLTIVGCEELINLQQNEIRLEKTPEGLHSLTSLRELSITNCNALTSWPKETKHKNACLENLQFIDCHALTVIFIGVLPPSLKRLDVRNCENLLSVLDDKEDVNISTCLLEYLIIEECPSFMCLSSTGQFPATLTQLVIKKCSKLTTLSPRGQLPMTLKHLEIEDCSELTTISPGGQLPETLESLKISWCPKLESIVERFHNNMALCEISIVACEKLKSIPEGLDTLSSLCDIRILYCPSLVSFPESGFPKTILRVWIKACGKLKALPKVHTLTSLQQLSLWDCPSMSFPEEGLPASLASLAIQGHKLYKLLKEGRLGYLSSLKELYISGLPDILLFQVKEMGITLPPTLTRLYIGHFPNLRDLSPMGFQNLTSLQWLSIDNCPNLKSLPSLPPLPLELHISKCPLVGKQGIE